MNLAPDVTDHPARILVVDDELQNRKLLEAILTPEGFVFQHAASGADALSSVAAEPPDLVLLDVMMPDIDGYEVARRLKGDAATQNIPIIMVTVCDDRDAKMRGLEAGAEDVLSKPVDRAELRVRVRNLLRLKAYGDFHDRYSQRLEAEVAARTAHLCESEARFRRLWDSGLILIAISDAGGRISDVNEAGARLLGYSRAELLARHASWRDLTADEGKGAGEVAAAQLASCGVAAPWEQELLRKDGTRVPVLTGAAMLGSEGIAIAVDLTERKQAERADHERMRIAELTAEVGLALTQGGALREMLQRCAEAMVEHASAACARVWIWDARDRALVLHASAGECNFVVTAAPPETRGVAETRVPHVTNDVAGDPRIGDRGWAAREGLVAYAGYPLLVSGELVGVVSMFARHARSAAVLKGLASIAGQIAIGVHRSAGDTIRADLEGQLRQAQKMEAVGRLAGGVAHDFNNLLSVILSYADLMLDGLGADDPLRGDVDEIRTAGKRAADLTRQLLMFSRQQVLAPKVIDLNELLARMNKMLQRILGADVDLVFHAAPDLGRLCADPSSIEQLVMNLVVNARDAMPTGGTLTIETSNVVLNEAFVGLHVDAKLGPHVLLAVSDTGLGMDAATRSRIFEPFFTTKPVDKGTGLGLATVFGFTKQSGGNVWVSSEPGKGARFEIYLPRVDSEVEQPRRSLPLVERRGTETILLVDDDEQVRLVARSILQRHGYRVIDAKHAGEALLYCEQHPGTIDLLVTDVVMPQMSGPDLAKRLAKDRPDMRVLCMSGYTDESVSQRGIPGTEMAYLQKPITPESLTRKVREVLDG